MSCCDRLRDGLPQQTVVAIAAGASAGLVGLIVALVVMVVIVVAVCFGMRNKETGTIHFICSPVCLFSLSFSSPCMPVV